MIRRAAAPLAVATIKSIVSFGLLWSGFRSISDDDFARVTIAQRFAMHPAWDPSGTSWLPLPFWVYGGAMKLFGAGLATAQLTALLIGVYAAVGVWAIARAADLSPRAALIGGVIAALLPHAAHYGVAMVPDYPTAVLALAAVATLGRWHGPTRLTGAIAACLATLCRYETWPIAMVVAAVALFDARKKDRAARPWFVVAALVAPLGAGAWMLHGALNHGDAFFFVKRVAAYRKALGADSVPWVARLFKQPLALIGGEPELFGLTLGLLLVLAFVGGPSLLERRTWVRPTLALGSLIAFLIVGDLLDGAPTHHEERTLLVAWLAMAVWSGELLDRILLRLAESSFIFVSTPGVNPISGRLLAMASSMVALVVISLFFRLHVVKAEPFVDRSAEIQIGLAAKSLVPPMERLAVYTEDYGYFAVQAAFARPDDAATLLRRDPRQREVDPLSDPKELARRLEALQARYWVAPAQRRAPSGFGARVLAESNEFALMRR